MTERQTPVERIRKETAAEMIGVSTRTLERYVAAGLIRPLPVPAYPRYFATADVEQLKRTGNAVAS